MVGGLPVSWWGCLRDDGVTLPERWQTNSDGRGSCEPTDFEVECFVHLARHEQARVDPRSGSELDLLSECCGIDEGLPAGALEATEAGHTLVGFCPGISWFWPSENQSSAFAKKS
jgi:hypothetical protein